LTATYFNAKITASCVGIWTPSIQASLGPPESISQMTSQSVQPFLQGSRSCQTDRQTTLLRL